MRIQFENDLYNILEEEKTIIESLEKEKQLERNTKRQNDELEKYKKTYE